MNKNNNSRKMLVLIAPMQCQTTLLEYLSHWKLISNTTTVNILQLLHTM